MIPMEKVTILASGDSVPPDAMTAKRMGFDPMCPEYTRLAHERGLERCRMEKLGVAGERERGIHSGFRVGDNPVSRIG